MPNDPANLLGHALDTAARQAAKEADNSPVWSGIVVLRWREDNELMVGRVSVGAVYQNETDDMWYYLMDAPYGRNEYSTEAEARAALVAAVVKALEGRK